MNEWLDFVSSLFDSLAWPVSVATIVFLLRHEIRELIPALRRLRIGGFEAEFGRTVEHLEEKADESDLPLVPATPIRETAVDRWRRESSRGLVLDAWLAVENQLVRVAETGDLGLGPNPSSRRVLTELQRRNVAPEILEMIDQLRQLRNSAAHSPDFDVSVSEAERYATLAARIVGTEDEPGVRIGSVTLRGLAAAGTDLQRSSEAWTPPPSS